jgi:hypothetical protein
MLMAWRSLSAQREKVNRFGTAWAEGGFSDAAFGAALALFEAEDREFAQVRPRIFAAGKAKSNALTVKPAANLPAIMNESTNSRKRSRKIRVADCGYVVLGTVRVKFTIENMDGAHRSGVRCTLAE